MAKGNDKLQHCVQMAIIPMNKETLQKPNRFSLFLVITKDVERTLAIGTRLGEEIHIQEVDTFLYLLVGKNVINKDLSPSRPTFKFSKNVFEILVAKE
jgi:hypothetical protein